MNWLERARREISKSARRHTANSAESRKNSNGSNGSAQSRPRDELAVSIGSNGSALAAQMHQFEALREAYEERAKKTEGGRRASGSGASSP